MNKPAVLAILGTIAIVLEIIAYKGTFIGPLMWFLALLAHQEEKRKLEERE